MRKAPSLILALAIATAGTAAQASTSPISTRLDQAKEAKEEAQATLSHAEGRLREITADYEKVLGDVQSAASDVLSSFFSEASLSAKLTEAQLALDTRASRIFETGPAAPFELFLGSGSISDVGFVQEFAERAFVVDAEVISRVSRSRAELDAVTERLESRQADLQDSASRLQDLAEEAAAEVQAAESAAKKAGLQVKQLEEEKRAFDEAQAKAAAALAALIGPVEIGAGCASGTVHDLIVKYFTPLGKDQVDFALGIATRESNCRPNAYNQTEVPPYGHASGVFQILYPGIWDSWSERCGRAGANPFDAEANVAVAACVVADQGWWPWGF